MSDQNPAQAKNDVLGPAEKIASIMRHDASFMDRAVFQRGDNIVSIYHDANFKDSFKNVGAEKLEIIKLAIEDFSMKAFVLSQQVMVLTFLENKIQRMLVPLSEQVRGTVIFKVGLKNALAFQRWRQGSLDAVTQDDINAAIYRLAFEWSKLLPDEN